MCNPNIRRIIVLEITNKLKTNKMKIEIENNYFTFTVRENENQESVVELLRKPVGKSFTWIDGDTDEIVFVSTNEILTPNQVREILL